MIRLEPEHLLEERAVKKQAQPRNGISLLKRYNKSDGTDTAPVTSVQSAYGNFYSHAKKSHLHETIYLLFYCPSLRRRAQRIKIPTLKATFLLCICFINMLTIAYLFFGCQFGIF